MSIENLINEANSLKKVDWKSPLVDKYALKVKRYFALNYGSEEAKIIDKTMRVGVIYPDGYSQNMINHKARIQRIVEFLESYSNEVPLGRQIVRAGTLDSLHPLIQKKCSKLYISENYAAAVDLGFRVVKDRLRELTNYESGSEAFGKGNLFVDGATAKNVERDFQEAVKFLTMSIDYFRNEKLHTSDSKITEHVRAYEYLSLSSLALNLLENAHIGKSAIGK